MELKLIKKIRNNRLLLNGSLFALYSFFQRGTAFILLIILAKFISPADYGSMSLFNTVSSLFGYFIGLNTAGYVSVSYFANKNNRDEFRYDFTTIIITTFASIIFLCICIYPFSSSLSAIASITPAFLYLALFIASFQTFFQILLNYQRIQEKVIDYGIYSCSNSILTFLFVIIFVLYLKQGWHGYVYGQLITLTIITGLSIYLFYKWELFSLKGLSFKRFKEIASWGIPLIPHLGAIWIRQGMDRYIIDNHHSTADVGFFSFAINLVSVIVMVGMSFNNTFSVNIFNTLSSDISLKQKKQRLKRQSKKIMIIYIVSSVLIILGASIFIPIIMPNYKDSIQYFYILSLYGLSQCFYFLYCNYLFYYKRTKTLMYITFGSSILHLLLSLLLTPYSLFFTCCIYVFIQIIIVCFVRKIGLRLIS